MNCARQELYQSLEQRIGRTPLHKISHINTQGHTLFFKEELANPFGSHYDRVFLALFRYYEERGIIVAGITPVVETTSGSAGVSFGALAKILGFESLVICPDDLPSSRLQAIRETGSELRLTPGEDYIDGCAKELARIFRVENKERRAAGKIPYFGLNHSQGISAQIAATSVESVVEEAILQGKDTGINFDLIVGAAGNGTTLLGFGRVAKRYGIPFVVWEPLGSGLCYEYLNGTGSFTSRFGIGLGLKHKVYGTVFGPTPYHFPNLDTAFAQGLVHEVLIVGDVDTKVRALPNLKRAPAKEIAKIPCWEPALKKLCEQEGKSYGRSSAGNLAAIEFYLCEHHQGGKPMNILTFAYDDLRRY